MKMLCIETNPNSMLNGNRCVAGKLYNVGEGNYILAENGTLMCGVNSVNGNRYFKQIGTYSAKDPLTRKLSSL